MLHYKGELVLKSVIIQQRCVLTFRLQQQLLPREYSSRVATQPR